jgi:hypothetical protein
LDTVGDDEVILAKSVVVSTNVWSVAKGQSWILYKLFAEFERKCSINSKYADCPKK